MERYVTEEDVLFCLAVVEEMDSLRRSVAAERRKVVVDVLLLRRGERNCGAFFCDRSSGRDRLGSLWSPVRAFAEGGIWGIFCADVVVLIPPDGEREPCSGHARKLGQSFQGDRDCIWARGIQGTGAVKRPLLVAWDRPPAPYLKLNTDASVGIYGAFGGGVVRSSEGTVIFAFYKEFGEVGVVHAEALALMAGLTLCRDRQMIDIRVESDSGTLVQMVNLGALARWPVCNVLRNIRGLVTELGASLCHIYRQANMVADSLASLQLGQDQVYTGEELLPRRVRRFIRLDSLGIPYVRA
ncbi:uncharacterized protein LOC113777166 [Coffea eugenioides]|uniref:uncharacterized protein LOC113777166 n=1 Tax=Coffea eugenioides TaxID=49369 RepID=UPI000F606677|nr:uncharacterized protein LOC113777166 [Coffea eugenioides]